MIPDSVRALLFRFRKLIHRGRVEREIDNELQFHLQVLIEENLSRGMTEEEARASAVHRLGGSTSTREAYRDRMTFPLIESFARDAAYAFRALRKAPGFTLTATIVLGLGIGINAGLVSIVRTLCYRPLPLPRAERLVGITRGHRLLSKALFDALREHGSEQIEVGAYDPYVSVQVGSTPHSVARMSRATLVSDNYFHVLSARPRFGRTFEALDNGVSLAAVLSQRLATRYFGAESNAAGKTIRVNQRLFTVIGVMPAEFHGLDLVLPDMWIRLRDEPVLRPGQDVRQDPNTRRLLLIGRLQPNVSRPAAEAALATIAGRVPEWASPAEHVLPLRLEPAVLFPLHSDMLPFVLLLIAPTGMVLLIACANLANLLLARMSRRGREIATRLALGASRGRLVRQLMTEAILLALFGGAAGTLLAEQLLRNGSALLAQPAANMGIALPTFPLDAGAWVFTLAISLLAAVGCGLAPALSASRRNIASSARQEAGGVHGSRVRSALMVAQVAVCTLLLSAAGLMIRSFQRSLSTDPGFTTDGVVALQYNLGTAGYSSARASAFQQQLRARLRASQNVLALAQAAAPPLSDRPTISLVAFGKSGGGRSVDSPFNLVSGEFFELFGIPMVAGRSFTGAEIAAQAPVAIVSRAAALRLWPGQSAVGQRLKVIDESASGWREVVGMAADTRSVWLSRVDESYVYLPAQASGRDQTAVIVKLRRDTDASRAELAAAIRATDPELPVSIQPMRDVLNQWRLIPLAGAALAMCLAMAALALAGVGMYGVMSYLVGQRKREFGIRMALGAGKRTILSIVFRQGLRTVLLGLGIGWIGAIALARVLMSSFYGLSPYDPAAFLFVAWFLGTAALASMYGPANRAVKVDPVNSLRED